MSKINTVPTQKTGSSEVGVLDTQEVSKGFQNFGQVDC